MTTSPTQHGDKGNLRAWLLTASAGPEAGRVLVARALRGVADGCVSVLLASYLAHIGFTPLQISAIVTGTLLGSAALTLAAGLLGHRLPRRTVLLGVSGLMVLTGLGFVSITAFWPLLIIAVVGTLNPSAGDVSLFLPTEQALLPDLVGQPDRTAIFARYNLAGTLAGACGALVAGVPELLTHHNGWAIADAQRTGFGLYTALAVIVGLLYATLSPRVDRHRTAQSQSPLAASRGIVLRLAALFSLDSFGGGFVVQAMLALWLFRRFTISVETAGAVFFVAGLLTASSQLLSPWIARRIGLINTMVFTHLPSNLFLILAALMPSAPLAILFILLRLSLSQMDIPARQSYVMAVVPPEERAAAASVTNVPRSLATAVAPLLAGALLSQTSFGWPLICAGITKTVYDVLLLLQFRAIKPPEEIAAS